MEIPGARCPTKFSILDSTLPYYTIVSLNLDKFSYPDTLYLGTAVPTRARSPKFSTQYLESGTYIFRLVNLVPDTVSYKADSVDLAGCD